LTISIMEALWATILFSGFALEVIIRQEEKHQERSEQRQVLSDIG